jgi:hypothetical protein
LRWYSININSFLFYCKALVKIFQAKVELIHTAIKSDGQWRRCFNLPYNYFPNFLTVCLSRKFLYCRLVFLRRYIVLCPRDALCLYSVSELILSKRAIQSNCNTKVRYLHTGIPVLAYGARVFEYGFPVLQYSFPVFWGVAEYRACAGWSVGGRGDDAAMCRWRHGQQRPPF